MPVLELLVCAATCVADVAVVEVTMAAPRAEPEAGVPGVAFEAPACAWSVAKRFCMKVLRLCATAVSMLLGALLVAPAGAATVLAAVELAGVRAWVAEISPVCVKELIKAVAKEEDGSLAAMAALGAWLP